MAAMGPVSESAKEDVLESPTPPNVGTATNELKEFVVSEAGQELIQTVSQVLLDVHRAVSFCRDRHRAHGFFQAASGAAVLTGGIIVIVAGAVMSGGTALPAEITVATAFFAGGTITLASAAGVQIVNTLTSLGFDKFDAHRASNKMLALTELIQQWDIKFGNLLRAGGGLGSLSEGISVVSNSISGVQDEKMKAAKDIGSGVYGAVKSGVAARDAIFVHKIMKSFLDIGLDGSVASASCYGAVSPGVWGVAKAGSEGARGIFFGLTGVGVAFSLVDIVAGLGSMFSGQAEAADHLDAHADKLSALMQIMLVAARGTPAADEILGQDLPQLLLVSIRSCTVRRPSYRFGDLTKRAVRGLSGHDVYFTSSMGKRNRQTEGVTLSEHHTAVDIEAPQVIIMRVLNGDEKFSLQMCAQRVWPYRLTLGDSSVGNVMKLKLPEAQAGSVRHACDSAGLEVEYQLLDPPQGQSGRVEADSGAPSESRKRCTKCNGIGKTFSDRGRGSWMDGKGWYDIWECSVCSSGRLVSTSKEVDDPQKDQDMFCKGWLKKTP